MRGYEQIKKTRREYLRAKKRQLKIFKKAHRQLRMGSILHNIYDGTTAYFDAISKAEKAIDEIGDILESLSF